MSAQPPYQPRHGFSSAYQQPAPAAGQAPAHWQPAPVRRARDVGVPVALLAILALVAAGIAGLFLLASPGWFLIGAVPSTLALAIGVACYLWLDRWEPEPPRLLVFAFLWGGAVAVVGALVVGTLLAVLGIWSDPYSATVVQAPIVEELFKGAFLLVMLTGSRKREMNSLIDHLVYAGMVGLGFAFVENLIYFSSAETFSDTALMAAVRTGFNMFGHSAYTTATAIGIYYSRNYQGATKVLMIVGGFCGAITLHAIWNLSATLGIGVLITVYVLILAPGFFGLVWLGIRSRRREGEMVARYLPGMVAQGLLDAREATWIASLEQRKQAKELALPQDRDAIDRLVNAVTELAFVRQRIDNQEMTSWLRQENDELVCVIVDERRSAAATLQRMAGQLQPMQLPIRWQ